MKRCLPSKKSKIHQDFQHLFKADLILLTHTPTLALHSTNQSKPSCSTCLSNWLTGLTLGKYTCNNVQLQRCKLKNALIITSANYLYLHAEQLFKTSQQFIRKNFKIMSMKKCSFLTFWVLTCEDLVHNYVFHKKFLLNTCTFLFNVLFL